MSELTDTLDKVIQKAALDGALTHEAVAQFHTLVKERDALKDANEEWERNDKVMTKERDELRKRVTALDECCQDWAGKEQDLMDRENKCTELEVRKECAEDRVKDHQEMFRVVFRNAIVRKEVMSRNDSHTESTGASHSSYETKETLEEKEE